MSNTLSFPQPWVANTWNAHSHLPGRGDFRQEERERKAWKRMMPCCAISALAIWKAKKSLITVTAVRVRQQKSIAGEGNGPGLLVPSPGWHNHGSNVMALPYESTLLEHLLQQLWRTVSTNAHNHLQIHPKWRTTGKDHWQNHTQNIATGKAENEAGIKHQISTKKPKQNENPEKPKHIKGHGWEQNQVSFC